MTTGFLPACLKIWQVWSTTARERAGPASRRRDALLSREGARLLGEALGAQQLATNRAGETLRVRPTADAPRAIPGPREDARQQAARFPRGKHGCHGGKVAEETG